MHNLKIVKNNSVCVYKNACTVDKNDFVPVDEKDKHRRQQKDPNQQCVCLFVTLSSKLTYSWSHKSLKNNVTNIQYSWTDGHCWFYQISCAIFEDYFTIVGVSSRGYMFQSKLTTAYVLMKGHVSSKTVWIIDGLLIVFGQQ